MENLFSGFPPDAHPMSILSSVTGALAIYCKDSLDPRDPEQRQLAIYRTLGKKEPLEQSQGRYAE